MLTRLPSQRRSLRPRLEVLEDRLAPAGVVVVTADQGGPPLLRVYGPKGDEVGHFYPFPPTFQGGVRVATGDITGDGVSDIFAAGGPGGAPVVRVFDGQTFWMLREIQVFGTGFSLGVNLAVGDVQGDAGLEVVVAPDKGGSPYVNVFDPQTGVMLSQMRVFGPAYRGGVRVAAADTTGDGKDEILVAARKGAPVVNVFTGAGARVAAIQAYASTYTGGLFVTAGDIDGGGKAEVIVGTPAGVRAFEASTGQLVRQYQPVGTASAGVVRVGVVDANDDGRAEVLLATGGQASPRVRVYDFAAQALVGDFVAYDAAMTAGLFVAGGRR